VTLCSAVALAALVVAGAGARADDPGISTGIGARSVGIFYYPWYGTPTRDGGWQHWQQNDNAPPRTIASGWYPLRGAYSSDDPAVLRAQMREIAAAGIDTVIVSWWGPGSVEDARFAAILFAARAAGLRVAVHVEPYPGRTPANLAEPLEALASQGVTDFYIYDSTASGDADWAALNARLGSLRLFANTGLPGKAQAGGFDGLYTYDVYVYDGSSFPRACASARRLGLICAPSVGPGYDARRATGDPRVRSRADGATYDRMWRGAIRAGADQVTITSYNEWHEGTQIEPAQAVGGTYASYDGAWGTTGRAAQRAYLTRTGFWVQRYHALAP
jgi:glycoprotein endo-alpha-1,2-mannosidase